MGELKSNELFYFLPVRMRDLFYDALCIKYKYSGKVIAPRPLIEDPDIEREREGPEPGSEKEEMSEKGG